MIFLFIPINSYYKNRLPRKMEKNSFSASSKKRVTMT